MKYWLRDGWEHLSVYLSLRAGRKRKGLSHGRVRCIVLGHEHSPPIPPLGQVVDQDGIDITYSFDDYYDGSDWWKGDD